MERFIKYLHAKKKYGVDERKIVNIYKRVNDIATKNKCEYDNFHLLISEKDQIRTWLFENLSMGTICNYATALCHSVSSMDMQREKIQEIKRFYLDIGAESQRLKNKISGKTIREFIPKRNIKEINDIINKLNKSNTQVNEISEQELITETSCVKEINDSMNEVDKSNTQVKETSDQKVITAKSNHYILNALADWSETGKWNDSVDTRSVTEFLKPLFQLKPEIFNFKNNNKIKSRMISRPLRRAVWNKYVGEHVGSRLCFCCELSVVSQLTFEVGHVVSVLEGGTMTAENLRPICSSCNRSMGSMNMIRFVKIQGLKGVKNFM